MYILCIYEYIYIYICTYIYIHTYVCIYIYIHTANKLLITTCTAIHTVNSMYNTCKKICKHNSITIMICYKNPKP